jgi:hypothetical protein
MNYDPNHYIPLNLFQKQWKAAKENGASLVEDPYALNPLMRDLSATMRSCAQFIMLFAMIVISLTAMGIRGANPEAPLGAYFANPIMWGAVGFFVYSSVLMYQKVSFAVKLKNAADFALLESARRYLKQRYGFLPINWENRFISYLIGEPVQENKFSETYNLTVTNYKGFQVFMIRNVNGEAPVKN